MSLSSQPTLTESSLGTSPIKWPLGPPSQPQNNDRYPQNDDFALPPLNWVKLSCHFNLTRVGLDLIYHSSMSMGAPITAPKQWQMPPKGQDFPSTPSKWVLLANRSRTIKFHMECLCHLILPPGSRPPIYDYGPPHHRPKTTDTLKKTLMVTKQNSVILGVSANVLGL